MDRPLGSTQKDFLWSLHQHKGWYPGGGWYWDSLSGTKKIAESLVRRGLVVLTEVEIPVSPYSLGYDPKKNYKPTKRLTYVVSEAGLKLLDPEIKRVEELQNKRDAKRASENAAARVERKLREHEQNETRAALEAMRDRLRAQMTNFEVEALSRAIAKFS